MKCLGLWIGAVFLTGCSALIVENYDGVYDKKKSLTKMNSVVIGMSYPEVIGAAEDSVIIGYKQNTQDVELFESIRIKNPYRQEDVLLQGKNYHIVYFFTQISNPDGTISDDELTPLVFENEKLIGKGWDFVFQLRSQL